MNKDLVEARKKEVIAGETGDKVDEKKFSNFKLSLLKTSLEHYDSLTKPKPPPEPSGVYQGSDLGTLKTLKLVRQAVSKWKKKADSNYAPLNPSVMSPRKSINQSPIRSRLSSESGQSPIKEPRRNRMMSDAGLISSPKKSKGSPPNASGRQSRTMSRSKSLVPCTGPGHLDDYISYVKSGTTSLILGCTLVNNSPFMYA